MLTFFIIALIGCGAFDKNLGIMQLQTQRPVENNVFSSSFPEIKIQINQDLKYLGRAQLAESAETRISNSVNLGDRSLDANSYLFGQIDQNNRLAKGVFIRVLVMHGDPSQIVPEIFLKTSPNILESGEMKILEEQYHFYLYTIPDLLTQKEKDLLMNSRVPSCFLVKQLSTKSGLGNKSRVQVFYFEDLSNTCANQPCNACLDTKNRTAEWKQFLQGFTDRSYASIRFLRNRTVEDTSSRYVDKEPMAQPAPVEKIQPRSTPVQVEMEKTQTAPTERVQSAPPEKVRTVPIEKAPRNVESTKADTVEKRLDALKRIYDKNLISKEDYEKKKAEILKEL